MKTKDEGDMLLISVDSVEDVPMRMASSDRILNASH